MRHLGQWWTFLTYTHLLGRSRAERGTVPPSSQSPTLTLTLIKKDVVVPSSPRSPLVPAVFGTGPVGLPAPNHTLSLFLRPCKHRACYSWSNPGSHTLRLTCKDACTQTYTCANTYVHVLSSTHTNSLSQRQKCTHFSVCIRPNLFLILGCLAYILDTCSWTRHSNQAGQTNK